MHSVVIDQPYQFIPPYRGRVWPWILRRLVMRRLNADFGIESLQCEGLDRLKESLGAGHGIVLAPNHCRPADPLVITELCHRLGVCPHTMASWHVFMQSRWRSFFLRRIGAFSVYREGTDRQALQAAIDILVSGDRPLVIFPEGVISRTNDRLLALMEGASFIARSAAKKRRGESSSQVVVHPIAIRYHYHGDVEKAVNSTLDDIEARLSWRPQRETDCVKRIHRVGGALLWLKEIEYFGQPQSGEIADRLKGLIDRMLVPLEDEWIQGAVSTNTVTRVKNLRIAVLAEMITGDLPEEERARRWDQLADMYIAQQISHYPPDYVRHQPTGERLLETVERFEEDLTDESRIHRPMSATVTVGTAIPVSPKRERGVKDDPVMTAIDGQLRDMLGIVADTEAQR